MIRPKCGVRAEIDHEEKAILEHPRAACRVDFRCDRAFGGCRGAPVQTVSEGMLLPGGKRSVGAPEVDDVITNFLVGRTLDQYDRPWPQSPIGSTQSEGRRS